MKPKQAFGVGVRLVGLIVALVGIYFLVCGLVIFADPTYSTKVSPAWHYLLFGIVDLVIGLALIRGVQEVVRFAYPDDDSDSDTKA
jgi:uncharacterized membrane protein HdeD (DUF308 family)